MKQPNNKRQEYSDFVKGANEFISIFNNDFYLIDCSDTLLTLLNKTRKEILGKHIVEFSPDIEKSGRFDQYKKVLETGMPIYLEDEIALTDLDLKHFEIKAYRVGTSLALAATDVTETKKVKQTLKKNEDMLNLIIEHSADYFTLVDTNGIILFSDKIMDGYTMEQVVGTPVYDFQNEESSKIMRRCFERVIKTRKPDKYEVYFKIPQGEILSFETTVAPVIQKGRVASLALNTRETTERRRTEDELKKIKILYDALLLKTGTVIFDQDEQLRYSFIHNTHPEFRNEEKLGKTDLEISPLDKENAKILTEIKQSVLQGGNVRREDVQTTINGETYYYDLIVQPIFDADGKISGINCASTDITERKKTELKLIESERRLKSAQKIGRFGHFSLDFLTDEPYWSEDLFKIYGLDIQKGAPPFEAFKNFIHEKDRKRVDDSFKESIEKKIPHETIFRWFKTDSNLIYIHSIAIFNYDTEGNAVSMFGVAQDITEQQLSENRLKESERRLKEAEKIAHLGYYEIDLPTGTINWSEETFRIFGMDPQKGEPTVEEYGNFIHVEDSERIHYEFGKSIGEASSFDQIYRIVRSNGEIRYLHGLANIEKNPKGEAIKMFGTVQDITKITKAEADLRNAMIDGQEQERQRIAADLHDAINPLLSTAKLNMELFAEQYEAMSPEVRSNLDNAITLLERSMNDIRAISANLIPSVLKDFGLLQALNDLCKKISQGGTLEVIIDSYGLRTRLDRKTELILFRIAQELLNNIIKHAHASKAEVQLVQHKKSLVMMVTDDGEGLSQPIEILQYKGLGFRNIKSRVQSLNGKMEVDSIKKSGTTVTIELPYANG